MIFLEPVGFAADSKLNSGWTAPVVRAEPFAEGPGAPRRGSGVVAWQLKRRALAELLATVGDGKKAAACGGFARTFRVLGPATPSLPGRDHHLDAEWTQAHNRTATDTRNPRARAKARCRTRTGDPFLTMAVRLCRGSLSTRPKPLHKPRIRLPQHAAATGTFRHSPLPTGYPSERGVPEARAPTFE
jgi:hypothetical protein